LKACLIEVESRLDANSATVTQMAAVQEAKLNEVLELLKR